MNRKLLIALGIVASLAVGGALNNAYAVCGDAKPFQLAFGASDKFLVFPVGTNKTVGGGIFLGRWWQAGARNLSNEGFGTATPCPEAAYMVTDPPGGSGDAQTVFGFQGGDWGQPVCEGFGSCTSGPLVLLFQTLSNDGTKSFYAVGKAADNNAYDFGAGSAIDWNLAPIPRPRVTNSSRGGTNVTVNLTFDAPSVGARGESDGFAAESIVTSYQLLRFTGTADPGRTPAAWGAPIQTLATTAGGATVTGLVNDCSNLANDVFLATRAVFDGGQYSSDYVSEATRIECDPNLADPRFKLIDKKKPSRGTIQPR